MVDSVVTELRSRCSPLKSQYLRGKCWQKGKFALFQRLATLGEGRFMSKGQLSSIDQWARTFKGEFQGCTSGGRGLHVETVQSALTVVLKLVMRWSDQCHLDCCKYNQSSVPGSVCSNFFEASSQNCGSLCHGYSLVIMQFTSSTWQGFQYL